MSAYNKESGRVGEIYAQTLFDIAAERQVIDVVKSDMNVVGDILTTEKYFRELMCSPYFTRQHKAGLLQRVFLEKLSELTMDFLMVVIGHNRIKFLPDIVARFNNLWNSYRGFLPVKVTVSRRMDDGWVEKLRDDIASAIKRNIRLEVTVDPFIIGGIIIRYGDRVVDNTVRTRLLSAVKVVTGAEKRWMKPNEV